MSTGIITKEFYDPKVPSEGRVVYFKPNGNDSNTGESYATCLKTLSQAITSATALVPTPDDPVTITTDSSDNFTGTWTLPDNVNLFIPGARLEADSAGPVLTMGSNCRVAVDTIDNANGPAVSYSGKFSSTLAANGLTSALGNAIEHTNSSYFNKIDAFLILGATRCAYNTSASSNDGLVVNCDNLLLTQNNGIAVESTSVNKTTVDADKIGEVGALTGTVGLKGTGIILAEIDEIVTDTAIEADNGGQITAYIGNVTGDITSNVGGVINCWVLTHAGTVVNNGTINGAIAGQYYGTFAQSQKTVVEITSADSPYTVLNPSEVIYCDTTLGGIVVNLPALLEREEYVVKKADVSANTVTINANGADTIDSAASAVIAGGTRSSLTIFGVTSEWIII